MSSPPLVGHSAIVLLIAIPLSCRGTQVGPETAETVTTPSGGDGHTVECEQLKDCYAQAGELCPSGYVVVDARDGTRRASGPAEGLRMIGSGLQGERYTATNRQTGETVDIEKQPTVPEPRIVGVREMLIECKTGESTEPPANPKGAVGARCENVANCVRLRLGLRDAGFEEQLACAPDMGGVNVCTFRCDSADADTAARLEKLCTALRRKCVATGEDQSQPTCHSE